MAVLGSTKVTDLTLLNGVIGNVNPITTNTYTLGTSSLKWNNIYSTTFTGALSGNASSATAFSSNATVALTGDATGTSAGSTKSWSVPVTLANSGVTAGSYGPSANASPAHSGTFSVPYITVDAKGRVTSASTKTITLPASGNTDAKVTQTATTTSASYEVLFSATADNTTRTEGARKNSNLTFNPSSGLLTSTISKATELNTSNCGTAAPTSSTAHAGGTGSLYFQYGTSSSSSTMDPDVDKIYPVGSIYISTSSANPSTFFGGTWEAISGRFLLGANSTYTGGSTGGAATVTLTTSQIPAHTHGSKSLTGSLSAYTWATGSAGGIVTKSTPYQNMNMWDGSTIGHNTYTINATHTHDSVGGGTAHENMPPYLAVYIWKRTS